MEMIGQVFIAGSSLASSSRDATRDARCPGAHTRIMVSLMKGGRSSRHPPSTAHRVLPVIKWLVTFLFSRLLQTWIKTNNGEGLRIRHARRRQVTSERRHDRDTCSNIVPFEGVLTRRYFDDTAAAAAAAKTS